MVYDLVQAFRPVLLGPFATTTAFKRQLTLAPAWTSSGLPMATAVCLSLYKRSDKEGTVCQ